MVQSELVEGEYRIKRTNFVREITVVLLDWREYFSNFFLKRDPRLPDLRHKILELIKLRSQILTCTLPVDELRKVKLDATTVIDTGNSLLGTYRVVYLSARSPLC